MFTISKQVYSLFINQILWDDWRREIYCPNILHPSFHGVQYHTIETLSILAGRGHKSIRPLYWNQLIWLLYACIFLTVREKEFCACIFRNDHTQVLEKKKVAKVSFLILAQYSFHSVRVPLSTYVLGIFLGAEGLFFRNFFKKKHSMQIFSSGALCTLMKIIYYYSIYKVQSMEACVSWHKPPLYENGSPALSPLQTPPAESWKGPEPHRCAQPRSPRAQFSLTISS